MSHCRPRPGGMAAPGGGACSPRVRSTTAGSGCRSGLSLCAGASLEHMATLIEVQESAAARSECAAALASATETVAAIRGYFGSTNGSLAKVKLALKVDVAFALRLKEKPPSGGILPATNNGSRIRLLPRRRAKK